MYACITAPHDIHTLSLLTVFCPDHVQQKPSRTTCAITTLSHHVRNHDPFAPRAQSRPSRTTCTITTLSHHVHNHARKHNHVSARARGGLKFCAHFCL